MNISEISIKNPVFAWMMMSALMIFGGISFFRLGVSQLPEADLPVVSISATLEGAAPEVIETDVIDVLEEAVLTVSGVKNISSTAKSGQATIQVEFDLSQKIDLAAQEIQNQVAKAQRQLPDDIDPPVVSKSSTEDRPLLWFAVSSKTRKPADLMAFVRDRVKDQFATISGVSDIFLGGYVDPNLRVRVSTEALQRNALTIDDLIYTIQSEHIELPSGRIENDRNEINIRTLGEAKSVEDFGKLLIKRRGGAPNYRPVALNQVAQIEEGLADVRRISRFNQQGTVGVGIRKQRGANSVAIATAVKERAEIIKKGLPDDIQMNLSFDSTQFIVDSVHELNFTLILAAILTALVCWLFLGSWQATLNVIMAIPTSVLGAFIVLYFLGFTLNTFTLLGLSLGIGIIVDDAIMVLENIVRHYEEGEPGVRGNRLMSALTGARQITFSALAATAAIIAIFLPVAFMNGVIGKFFFEFGLTISVSVLISLLEALTLTPMRCSQLLDVGPRTSRIGKGIETGMARLTASYARVLPWLLDNRWKTVFVSIGIFLASLSVFKVLKKEFVPSQDMGRIFMRIQTPLGSSISFTDKKVKEVENILSKNENVERIFVAVGGFGGGDVNTSTVFLTLKPKGQRLPQNEVVDQVRQATRSIPDLKVFVQDLSLAGFGGGRGFPIEFSLKGPDWKELTGYSEQLKKAMEDSKLMIDVDSNYQGDVDELKIVPNRERAKIHDVNIKDIGETVSALMGGKVVGRYLKDGRRSDIRIKIAESEHPGVETLKKIFVRNNRGELIRLTDLVTVSMGPGPLVITRENRSRAISLFANPANNVSQQAAMDKVQALAKDLLPTGYYLEASGSSKSFKESMGGLLFAFILGLVVSYMVLASQSNSFIDPFTVLVALPFSISGALVSLWLTGHSFNVYSVIGLLLLMGLVKKNSILLVDFTNQMRGTGKSIREALLIACPMRLRAILMTTISTIVGALPAAMAIGPGAESRVPMAIAIIGGMIFSTILTLFVVPCVYYLAGAVFSLPPKNLT